MKDMLNRIRAYARYAWENLAFLPLAPLLVMGWTLKLSLKNQPPFYPPEDFPELDVLRANFDTIRAEFQKDIVTFNAPKVSDVEPSQAVIDPESKWRGLLLRAYGRDVPANQMRFPNTTKVLESIPGLYTAFFSILEPGARLKPHKGLLKGVLRVHLGVEIPEACGISVGDEARTWTEGELMVFDDTYMHSAWNESARPRVVLFMDHVRPIEAPFLRSLNEWTLNFMANSRRVQSIVGRG